MATAGEALEDQWDYHLNSPIYQNNTLYLASKSGAFYALDISDGTEKWSLDLNSKLRGTPFITEDTILLGSKSSVLSVNLSDGVKNWEKTFNMPTSPQLSGNVVVFGSRNARVYGLDVNTGDQLWSVNHGSNWVTGQALAYDGNVYIGTSDNALFQSINAENGDINWSISSGRNVFSQAVIVNDTIFISSGDAYSTPGVGFIKAIDMSGNLVWSLQSNNFMGSPIVDDNTLYIGGNDGYFHAVNIEQ